MGFWNKLGKIALVAAPYVAAPFTGGASLAFTGAANKAAQKWMEHDAKKAIQQGKDPSKFDKYLMTGANVGSLATGVGAFSGGGMGGGGGAKTGTLSATGKNLSGWQKNLQTAGNISSAAMGAPTGGGWESQVAGLAGQLAANRDSGGGSIAQPEVARPTSIAAPRRSGLDSIFARGRNEAIVNQPFRRGYETVVQGDDDTTLTHTMPPIYPNYGPPPSDDGSNQSGSIFNRAPVDSPSRNTPIQNAMRDELTPRRMARRRNPVVDEE